MQGMTSSGQVARIALFPEVSPVRNDAFDITPAELVSGLITERGIVEASREGLRELFPELALDVA